MIPTYNCATYLRETLASVLAQDPGPDNMQIEVIDDCSTADDPQSVVADVGRGRVLFHRQEKNVGHVRNFETCLQRSRGRLVHLLHGDDAVLPGFYEKLARGFSAAPEAQAAFCRHIITDEDGNWQTFSPLEQPNSGILPNWLERIIIEQRIQTPSVVVKRNFYESHGGFDDRVGCTEDWEMWIRIAAHSPVWYESEALALYRKHSSSLYRKAIRSGDNIRYQRQTLQIAEGYLNHSLPATKAKQLLRVAREKVALRALRSATRLLDDHQRPSAMNQASEASLCSDSLKVRMALLRFYHRALLGSLRAALRPVKRFLVGPRIRTPDAADSARRN